MTDAQFEKLKAEDKIIANFTKDVFTFVKSNKVFTTLLTVRKAIHETNNKDLKMFFSII